MNHSDTNRYGPVTGPLVDALEAELAEKRARVYARQMIRASALYESSALKLEAVGGNQELVKAVMAANDGALCGWRTPDVVDYVADWLLFGLPKNAKLISTCILAGVPPNVAAMVYAGFRTETQEENDEDKRD